MLSVMVVDLSYDGCRISTPSILPVGQPFQISVLGLGKMPANVRWYSDGFAGLSFRPEPIEIRSETPREHIRVPLKAEFLLRRAGRKNYWAVTADLSPSGCSVEFIERPAVGERHWVKFDGMDALEADIRWVDGFSAGLQFLRPIYPAVFELLLAKLR